MSEVKKNFIYNIIYQVLILILPLISVPYVSRVIGTEGVGIYSFTYSIVYYFMIFAMLGLNNYGVRSIAKVRDNKEKLSKTFKEIYAMQCITSTIMIFCYLFYVIVFDNSYKNIAMIQTIYIISSLFDINWFFFGIEKFKLTVTRNTVIKVLTLIAIFGLVKTSSDVWIYTLILSLGTLLSQLALFPFLKKYIKPVKIKIKDIKKHFKPCLKLFLPVIAIAIYRIMDKTMLGILKDVSQVGLYENAEKIINVPNAIITALGTVTLPRMSNLYSQNKPFESESLIEKSIQFIMFLAFPMALGLIAISKPFTLMFFGEQFLGSYPLIMILAITLIFLSWGNVLRTQYLIPKEKDKIYIISAIIGAVVNFVVNIILIYYFQAIGACLATVLAEFLVMFYQSYKIRHELPLRKYIKEVMPFFFKAVIMFIVIYPVQLLNISDLVVLILQLSLGVLIYALLNFQYIKTIALENLLKRIKLNP